MSALTREKFDRLSAPGPRFEWLVEWLAETIWCPDRYGSLSSEDYLKVGEQKVNELEEVIAAAAPRIYDELTQVPAGRDVASFLSAPEPAAVVIFDGLSLREMPVLLRLARQSSLNVVENGVSVAGLPSDTLEFVEQRLGCGSLAPSQLAGRRELKDRGIAAYYYSHPGERHPLDATARMLLLWSAFPDNTYRDSGARFAEHFSQIHALLEAAWKATVMVLPRQRRILITSDHGYVFLGAGLSFSRHREELRPLSDYLKGERYARLSERGTPPVHPDLACFPSKDVAMLKGRIHPHPPGPAANKLYKHGGLSLMEMLTPWLVLEA